MAPAEVRVAKPEWWWDCSRGTPNTAFCLKLQD